MFHPSPNFAHETCANWLWVTNPIILERWTDEHHWTSQSLTQPAQPWVFHGIFPWPSPVTGGCGSWLHRRLRGHRWHRLPRAATEVRSQGRDRQGYPVGGQRLGPCCSTFVANIVANIYICIYIIYTYVYIYISIFKGNDMKWHNIW